MLLLLACAHTPAPPATPAPGASTLQLSFEAVPGNGFDIHGQVYDTAATTDEQKVAFTAEILAEIVPDVFAAVAVDPADIRAELSPGGFQLQTSPSLQIRGELLPDTAYDLAAALGWTTFQWSVLVTDFGNPGGGTGYVSVRFPSPPDGPAAQAFFEHAASIDKGLAGGYTTFDHDLYFLNLRGPDGAPYSGLDDPTFVAGLTRAAASYGAVPLSVSASGQVAARLVEDRWTAEARNGEDYLVYIEDEDEPALVPIRAEYLEKLEETGKRLGWGRPSVK